MSVVHLEGVLRGTKQRETEYSLAELRSSTQLLVCSLCVALWFYFVLNVLVVLLPITLLQALNLDLASVASVHVRPAFPVKYVSFLSRRLPLYVDVYL